MPGVPAVPEDDPLRTPAAMIRSWVTILVVATGLAAEARAQVIRGRIIEDGTHRPIAHADIRLLDDRGRGIASTLADSLGGFEFRTVSGLYAFQAVAPGFVQATTPVIELGIGELLEIRVVLSPRAILLAPLEITARSRPLISGMTMQGFHERRAKNLGFALTREQIEQRKPRRVSDLLRAVPGVRVIPGGVGSGSIRIPGAGTRFRDNCEVKVLLDGFLFRWGGSTIDDIPVDDLEAIEVFRNLAETPPEYAGPDARCGVVAVWTRRGGN